MPATISQVRPEELQAAIDFAKTIGLDVEAGLVDPQISLLARDGETIIAAVLGVVHAGKSCDIQVCLSNLDSPGPLMRELIDKALMKVRGLGIRRCQINHHGPDAAPLDWPSANWTGEVDQNKTPNTEPSPPKPESEITSSVDTAPKSESDAQPLSGVDADTDVNVDVDAETKPDTDTDTDTDTPIKTGTQAEIDTDTQSQTDTGSKAESKVETQADTQAKPDTDTDTEAEAEAA